MSKETIAWLNANVLVGFIEDRERWAGQPYANTDADTGLVKPWFAREGYTGAFTGPVPVDEVQSRLFNWQAIEGPLYAEVAADVATADSIDHLGNPRRKVELADHKAIIRSDNDLVMGVFKSGYTVHQYDEWLIENIASILDDDVQIDSAGLLNGGGVAWVSVSMPEIFATSSNFAVRPRILSFTSHNGKHSTTYMRSVNAPVCDNSLSTEIAGGRGAGQVKIKHSAHSGLKIAGAREALGILYQQAEEVTAFFERLADVDVTNKQFRQILDRLEPMPDPVLDDGKVKNQRAITMAESRREEIVQLYVSDDRAAPWKGSALGVIQAFNTWDQQQRAVTNGAGGGHLERQMVATLDGSVSKFDREVYDAVDTVTGGRIAELVSA